MSRAPTLVAQAMDLVGGELDEPEPRPSVSEAVATIRSGQVLPASDRDGKSVAVFATKAGVFQVPDACPHDGGSLSDGFVDQGRLVCGRHGWEFDPSSGRCLGRSARLCPRRLAPVPLDS